MYRRSNKTPIAVQSALQHLTRSTVISSSTKYQRPVTLIESPGEARLEAGSPLAAPVGHHITVYRTHFRVHSCYISACSGTSSELSTIPSVLLSVVSPVFFPSQPCLPDISAQPTSWSRGLPFKALGLTAVGAQANDRLCVPQGQVNLTCRQLPLFLRKSSRKLR